MKKPLALVKVSVSDENKEIAFLLTGPMVVATGSTLLVFSVNKITHEIQWNFKFISAVKLNSGLSGAQITKLLWMNNKNELEQFLIIWHVSLYGYCALGPHQTKQARELSKNLIFFVSIRIFLFPLWGIASCCAIYQWHLIFSHHLKDNFFCMLDEKELILCNDSGCCYFSLQ